MEKIRKLLVLPRQERWLFFKAAALLVIVRLVLLLPFAYARRFFKWISHYSRRLAADPATVEQLVWAVNAAGRLVPGATHCLTQAITAQIFLMRRGYPAKLRYGVPRKIEGRFIAHAWLESNGIVVIGGPEVDSYVMLASPTDSVK
ncbi:MAG: lasso peptide biosynthesis B2 protein [Gammaproteobacteria bacterium]